MSTHKKIKHAMLALGFFLFFSPQLFAVVIYDESISGDAPDSAPGVNVSLVSNSDQILGSLVLGEAGVFVGFDGGIAQFDGIDHYQFEVGIGDSINSILFDFDTNIGFNLSSAQLLDNAGNALSSCGFFGSSSCEVISVGLGNITAGTYNLYTQTELGDGKTFLDYSLTFEGSVTPPTTVPEPSSIALFGLGLAGFYYSRKKIKN